MKLSKVNKEKLKKECAIEADELSKIISRHEFKIDNELTARQRTLHRNTLVILDAIPKFDKRDLKKVISVRSNSMFNNMSQFGFYLAVYYKNSNFLKRIIITRILGKKRLYTIIDSVKKGDEKDFITINEVFSLFKWLNLKKDFMDYVQSKTQFSYSVLFTHEIKAITNKLFLTSQEQATKVKFAQFVYMILSEYILLHNLMFVSGYKLEEIRSVDKWMKNL